MSLPFDESIYRARLQSLPKAELISTLRAMNEPVGVNSTREQLIHRILSRSSIGESQRLSVGPRTPASVSGVGFAKYVFAAFLLALLWNAIMRLWRASNFRYCQSGAADAKCAKCPRNSVCSGRSAHCCAGFRGYSVFGARFCVEDSGEWNVITDMIGEIWAMLRVSAGSFKCKKRDRDWLSIDEIDFGVFSKLRTEDKEFNTMLNKSLSYLVEEKYIVESQVNGTMVFFSIEYDLPYRYQIIDFFKGNLRRVINILIVSCILYVLSKRREDDSIIRKRYPHYMSMVSEFIRNSSTIEVADEQIIQRLEKETKDYLKYWKYIQHDLEIAPLIRVRKDGNHKYYRFLHE